MQPCRVVHYRPQHVEDVCLIDRLCFSDPWLKRSFIEEINAPCALNRIAALTDRGAPAVAFCLGRVIADEYSIYRLAVHPDFRRRGIAAMLLRTCMHHAALYGAIQCCIELRTGNTAARHLYERCGFTQSGIRCAYYTVGSEDALVMQCPLGPEQLMDSIDVER